MRAFLARIGSKLGATPRYVASDKGRQFHARGFRAWCRRRGIRPRYAAGGSLRATAIVERFIRSLKEEWLRRIRIPLTRRAMHRELTSYARWFETHRPHQGLGGSTPLEVSGAPTSATAERPIIDRLRPFDLVVRFHEGRRQLPIVELRQAG
jgi:transposase InsO family protein